MSFVIAMYVPFEGKSEALKAIVKRHLPILKQEGLVTSRESYIMESANGTIIEIFEWVSNDAIKEAHENANVRKIWKQFDEVCSHGKLNQLDEADQIFPGFKSLMS